MEKRMSIKEKVKKLVFGTKYSSDSYIKYLKNIGVTIGEDCIIYVPTKTFIDTQYPWLIRIGNHVRITEGVKILTHDYSWSVLKLAEKSRGAILGASGCIKIGNNVFIGMDSIITRNVTIGDNVIIGAGSIVTKDCKSNGVYAGNPASKIMEVDEFYSKRAKAQIKEAKTLALEYYKKYGEKPALDVFHEYFMIFSNEKMIQDNLTFREKIKLCDNPDDTLLYLRKNPPAFNSYDEFMRYCFNNDKE